MDIQDDRLGGITRGVPIVDIQDDRLVAELPEQFRLDIWFIKNHYKIILQNML